MRDPLSSSDNSQFDPQPVVSGESQAPVPITPDVRTLGSAPLDSVAPTSTASAPPTTTPVENPAWNGWDVLLIALLTILTLLVVEAMTVVGAWLIVFRHTPLGEVAQKPVLALIGEFLSYIAVAIYMVLLVEGKYHARFWNAIRWNWPRNATLKLLGLGVLTVSIDFLSRYLPMPKTTPFDQFFSNPRDAYLIAGFAVTIGPLMEELFFRGFLYPVLARRLGVAAGIFLTALPFGLIHYLQYKSWSAVLVITLVGVVLTSVRAVTKSVAASFLVHVGYNGTLMIVAALATDGFRHMDKVGLAQVYLR